MRFDLYVITDSRLCGDRPLLQVVAAALDGGATAVQLRDKEGTPRDLLDLGAELRRISHAGNAHFLVNDRVDLALVLEADGAHVGPEDLPPVEARRLLEAPSILGVSVGTVQEAVAAQGAGADYLGAGSVFPTPTKPDAGDPIGLDRLAEIASAVRIPVVGIGGIRAGNAASVIAAGAAGIAVISAVMAAENPEAAARELRAAVREAFERRERGRRNDGKGGRV